MIHLVILSFIFGFSCKIADLFDEHGLKEPFPFARIISGVVWGVSAVAIMAISPAAGLATLGLLLYWILSKKLDHTNHAIGGVIALLGSYSFLGPMVQAHILLLSITVLIPIVAKLVRPPMSERWPKSRPVWRLRPQIYVTAILTALALDDVAPLISTFIAMAPTEGLTLWFRWRKKALSKLD